MLTSEMQAATGIVHRVSECLYRCPYPFCLRASVRLRERSLRQHTALPLSARDPNSRARHCTAPAYCMNCQVPLSPGAPIQRAVAYSRKFEIAGCALLIDPLPTCPFYKAGMPTSLTISYCRLALLPTETSLVDEAESALTSAVMVRFAMLYHLRHSDTSA